MRATVAALTLCGAALAGCGSVATGDSPSERSVTCTDASGHARSWAYGSGGGQTPGSASVSGSGGDAKTGLPVSTDPRYPVFNAIASGIDPIEAARVFGAMSLADPQRATPEQLAQARDPKTYGWTC